MKIHPLNFKKLNRVPPSLSFFAAFFVCALVYLPALLGLPLWDDNYHWFQAPEMRLPFTLYFQNFAWPVSVSAQKFLLGLFGDQYWLYHLLNLVLHFLNSFLVYRLAKVLEWPRPHWIFLLFLFHPANVMAVAWMIQFKTLLCCLFALVSFLAFEKGVRNWIWFPASLALFILAVLSKSAAVPLPILLFVFACAKLPRSKWLWCAPFFAVSLWQCRVLLTSPVVTAPFPSVAEKNVAPPITPPQIKLEPLPKMVRAAASAYYYFWQSLLPLDTVPVKSQTPRLLGPTTIAFAVMVLLLLLFQRPRVFTLSLGFIFLIPFLGFVPAPYMNVTWVSDQHLYLALPLLLFFWMTLSARLRARDQLVVLTCFAVAFIVQTARTVHYFENEETFYASSLKADPANIFVAYNYAYGLASQGKPREALQVIDALNMQSVFHPELTSAPGFSQINSMKYLISTDGFATTR